MVVPHPASSCKRPLFPHGLHSQCQETHLEPLKLKFNTKKELLLWVEFEKITCGIFLSHRLKQLNLPGPILFVMRTLKNYFLMFSNCVFINTKSQPSIATRCITHVYLRFQRPYTTSAIQTNLLFWLSTPLITQMFVSHFSHLSFCLNNRF